MPKRPPRESITYASACDLLEAVLEGGCRGAVLDAVLSAPTASDALARLRAGMRAHVFRTPGEPVALRRAIQAMDHRTRREGFHVLASWDYRAHRFADDIAPILLLDRCAASGLAPGRERAVLSLLLDQYLLSVLGLLAVRAWDDGDPNVNLDRTTHLVRLLQGPAGSGNQFVDDAETLLLLAVSHYHPDETAYELLMRKVWALDHAHRVRIALACAATLGGHLRWGMRFMYKRDVGRMRADNVVDYPWLLFSVITIVRELDRVGTAPGPERERLVEGLLNGVVADPWAFTGPAPAAWQASRALHREAREWLHADAALLLDEFEAHRPRTTAYSPLAFQCNFLCNTLVAMVATAAHDPSPHPSLNALLSGTAPNGLPSVEAYARCLMSYAIANGDGRSAPLIVYDPHEGLHSFNTAVRVLGDDIRRTTR